MTFNGKITPERQFTQFLGYSIPELQEFINFAKEKDVDKLIKKIALLETQLVNTVEQEYVQGRGVGVKAE